MRTIALTLLLVVFINTVNSQGFEGVIVYKTTVENPNPERIPDEQFKMMFKDIDTSAILYLKRNRYKLVTLNIGNNQPSTVSLYNPDSTRLYSYVANNNDFCMWSDVKTERKPNISKNLNDNVVVLGQKCYSITFDDGINQTIAYFSDKFNVDVKSIESDAYGFLLFIFEGGAVPLKIIMKGNGAVHNIVFTATDIKEEIVEDRIFELPKFKQMMESPF